MHQILSERFGLYQVTVVQETANEQFFCDIDFLEEDGTPFMHDSGMANFSNGLDALKHGMAQIAELYWDDLEIAGKGTRTPDILLGKKSVTVKPSEMEVQS